MKKQFIEKFELAKRLANLFVDGMSNVELLEPKEDIAIAGNVCAKLENLKIELVRQN